MRLKTFSNLLRTSLVLVLLLLSSCGYQLQGSGNVLPKNIKKIFIADVANQTTNSGLEYLFRDALIDRFERYGTFRIVDSRYESDAVLSAKVLNLTRDTRSVTSNTDTALQLETTLLLSAELRETTGSVLWSNPRIIISEYFSNDPTTVVTSSANFAQSGLNSNDLAGINNRELGRGQEEQVLDAMFVKVAKRIYNSAVLPEF